MCSFCQQEIETYGHVFLHCKIVEDIWKNLITHYDLKEIRNMAWEDVFVGLSGSSIRIKFVNSFIIMLKYISLSHGKNNRYSTIIQQNTENIFRIYKC